MLETSPLLSNRYKRISSSNRPPSPSSLSNSGWGRDTKNRRKSSITFLLALTAISAVVTYYYDTNLAPYEQEVAKDGTTRFAVNEDFLTSVKLGSTVDEYGYRLSDEQRALARSMNVEKRIMAMTKDVWPECMAQHMQADVCKDFIDSEIATYFSGADRYIKTYIKEKRDNVDEWYNVIDMVMDDNNLVIGETGDGVVYYPFIWDGSGQEATVEAQTAIPPIIATETESGSQEAEVLTTVYAPMTAETEFMLRTAAATTTVSSTTTSSGSGGSTPQVTPPPTPNPTSNPTPNPVAPPPTTNSGQTNPQSSGFTPSTWAPVTPAPTDQPATNEPTVSPTTNEPSVSPTTNEPTTGTPTIAVTDAMTAQPQVQVQAQNTVVVNSGVSGSTITPPPTKDPTQKPTAPPTFPPTTPPPTPNPTLNPTSPTANGGTDPNVAPIDSGGAFDFQQPPLVVSAEPLISPGATTDGARSGTDTNPLNGGVVLSSNSHGTTEGLEELNRILAEPAVIEDAGPRMVGPFNCAGMTGYECCLIVKHQVRDSDVNGNAIQCHLDYDVTTCKKKYELEQLDNKKVYIYANHKYFVSKDPKVSNTWSTCTTKWTDGSYTRDWAEKDSSWSNAPTPTSYGNPTFNPTNRPTRQPTPQPTNPTGVVAPPLADLVPSTSAPCPAGYECLQDANFGVDVPTSPFKIDLVIETMNSDSVDAYKTAMNHWQEIIVGDLESVSTLGMENDGCSHPFPEVIDDMHICGKDTEMDGKVGGILGSASAMYERVTDGTVIAGNMEFDTLDVQNMIDTGTWESVIIHEMGHIIGIGSQWASKGIVQYNEQTGGYTYTGANGINVWKNVWQCSSDAPPIETDGGGGTAGLHWDEGCLLNERMTGYVNPVYNPTSLLTIANLADLGYVVDFTKAQAYDGYNMNNNIPGCCNPPARLMAATQDPTPNPTQQPTPLPTTAEPTPLPTPFPTTPPVADPTPPPSPRPTDAPTPPPTNNPTPNPTEQPTPNPTPLPTFAQAAALTAVPTTASPTQQPTIYSGQLAMNIITGEECVIPGSNTCSVEHDLSACDGNKPYCCNRDNGNNNGDYDKCTTQGGVRSCKAGIASPNTCGQIKPSSNAKNNEVGEECEGGLFCCIQEQGNKKWGSCMTQAECEAATGGDRRGLFSSFGALRNLAQDDEDDNTCKKKKDIPWKKKDKAWKIGMQKLRERKLPAGQARIQAGVKYVGDQKVSLLVEDEGMLYEVEVSADGSVVVS